MISKRPSILAMALVMAFCLGLQAETFTCTRDVTAYDVSAPTKPIGQFHQGAKLEIDQAITTPGFHSVVYVGKDGRQIVALCRDEDLNWSSPKTDSQSWTPPPASQPETLGQPSFRVLFIGNSYTYGNDLPSIVKQLAAKEPRSLETGMVAKPAYSLQQHWKDGEALKEIKRVRWDFVVIQEQSGRQIGYSGDGKNYPKLFASEIKGIKAKAVLFVPWVDQDKLGGQAAVSQAYARMAREIGAILAPVGGAWENALNGKPRIVLHASDTHHANPSGSYLAACVFYSLFYNKSPEGLSRQIFDPADPHKLLVGLVPADAARLQHVAWETLQKNR